MSASNYMPWDPAALFRVPAVLKNKVISGHYIT